MIKRYVQRAKRTISLFLENDVVVYAGHATLGIITAFFPLVMLIISLLNMIPWYSPEDFTNLVFRFLPDIPQMKNLFLGVVTNLRSQSNGLLASIAGATSLWSASGGVTAIQKGLIRISQNQRKGLKNKGISLLFTLFIVILIPAVLVFNFLGGALTDLVTSLAARLGFSQMTGLLVSVIRYSGIAAGAFAVLLLILLYTFLPGGKRELRAQVPGALLTAAVWIIFTAVFSRVMPIFWKSSIYGSLASLFLTLLWLRVILTILFIGAAWNEAAAEEKEDTNEAAVP